MTFLRPAIAALGLLAAAPAQAADLPNMPLQAADPDLTTIGWKGWTIGAGIVGVGVKGQKGAWGGDTFVGYRHSFNNGVDLDLRFATGYAPTPWAYSFSKGFDFAAASATAHYGVGPLRPFLTTTAAIARDANSIGPITTAGALNGAFNGPGAVRTLGSIGVGFDFSLTPDVTIGAGVNVGNAGGSAP